MTTPAWRRHYPKVLLVLFCLVVWELAVRLLKIEYSIFRSKDGVGLFRYLVLDTLYPFLLWTILALLPVRISADFPLDRRPRWKPAGMHLLGLLACLGLFHVLRFHAPHLLVRPLLQALLNPASPLLQAFLESNAAEQAFLAHSLEMPLYWAGNTLLNYLYVLAACHVFTYQQAARDQASRAARMEAQLSQAQLQTLKSQIQPHFLFNALANIHALIEVDDASAKRMVGLLSDFLRSSLAEAGLQRTSLARELAFVDRYLEIQEVRFSNRLRVLREIPPETLGLEVPHLLLQPLVENAIKHGIAPHVAPGTLWIAARLEGESLCLDIQDDGPEKAPGLGLAVESTGLGLRNVQERLHQLYGDQASLRSGPRGGRWEVEVRIPRKEVAP